MTPAEIRDAWQGIENQLKPADILMIHDRHSWMAKRIRAGSKSYWNHMAIILMPKVDLPIGGPLIIEASYSGVEIHQVRKYTGDFDRYDLGVMRVPDMTDAERESLAMKFILANLDREYDYVRLFGLVLGQFLQLISMKLALRYIRRITDREAFVCTTFVHRAIHARSAHLPSNVGVTSDDPAMREMIREEMITPGDISREPCLEWILNRHD